MTNEATIVSARARLVRVPVDPPRGDAIQQFDALELPIVEIADRAGRRGPRRRPYHRDRPPSTEPP